MSVGARVELGSGEERAHVLQPEHRLGVRAGPSSLLRQGRETVHRWKPFCYYPHILLRHLFSAESWRQLLGRPGKRSEHGFAR